MNQSSNTSNLPAPVAILQMLSGKWVSQAVYVAAELGLADHLAAGPSGIPELARRADVDGPSLHRLLRALASVGVFKEDSDGRFTNTELSEALRSDVPGSMRSMAKFYGDHPTWDAWGELLYSVRTGKSAFQKVHGLLPFEFLAKNPRASAYFNEAMTGFSAQEIAAVHAAFDFSGVKTVVDVGGGHGALLCSILERNPEQRGILFDQPHVIDGAHAALAKSPVANRCKTVGGDFFKEVPQGADGYVLKHILHDWNDEQATAIASTIRRVMTPGSRLFVIETVIQPGNEPSFSKLLDLEMLVLYNGGRERTQQEFAKLFADAGLRLTRVVETQGPACVIEAQLL